MLELYKELIMDHGLNPRNKYIMQYYTNTSTGYNQFCGDTITLYLNIKNDIIKEISFEGKGCSISIASASIMTTILKNKNIIESINIFNYLKNIMKNDNIKSEYQSINILANVKKFPSRVKCATLVWHTMINITGSKSGGTNDF